MTDVERTEKTKKYIRELYDEVLRIECEMADTYITMKNLFPDEGHDVLSRQDIKTLQTLIKKYELLLERKSDLVSTADSLKARLFTSKEFDE